MDPCKISKQQKGKPIPAALLRQLRDGLVDLSTRLEALEGGFKGSRGVRWFWAQVFDRSGYEYAWTEKLRDTWDGVGDEWDWKERSDALTSMKGADDFARPAYEVTGARNDRYIGKMVPMCELAGRDGETYYIFEGVTELGFWAQLTAEGSDGYYSWIMLEADAETDFTDPDSNTITGTDNAKEVNEREGIQTDASAPSGEEGRIVWMWPGGEDGSGNLEYRFEYRPPTEGFWARLKKEDATSAAHYSATVLEDDGETSTGTTISDAREVNDVTNIATDDTSDSGSDGIVVWCRPGKDLSGGGAEYEFEYSGPTLGDVEMWSGTGSGTGGRPTQADLGPGWRFMDGDDSGGTETVNGVTVPDLQSRFVVCMGQGYESGYDFVDYSMRDKGGFESHGNKSEQGTYNEHDREAVNASTAGAAIDVYAPEGSGLDASDNRPPFYAMAFKIYVGPY